MNFVHPSRADAWDMTRREKMTLTFLANTTSALLDAKSDLKERLSRIENGQERMDRLADECMDLLTEVRMTVPEKQRMSMVNTYKDYEMRLVPKMTPTKTNVVLQKEDMRTLVDAAQTKCADCTETFEESSKCKLCQLLKVILPMDSYEGTFLCPYNGREWEN